MSTTEDLIEATVTKDGTATVSIQGITHEFTAASEAAARAQTVELVSKHATERGTSVRAVMHDGQGSWPVKVHPDGTVEPDTTTPPASSDKPAARRRRVVSPVTHVANAERAVIKEPAMREEATAAAPEPPATAETTSEPEKPSKEPAQAADARQSATPAPTGPSSATAKAPQPNPFAQKSQSHTVPGTDGAQAIRREARQSFLTQEQVEEPATQGWRGAMTRLGIRMAPSDAERAEHADVQAVSQHWPGPRTIAIVNGKGGSGKTPHHGAAQCDLRPLRRSRGTGLG